MGKSNPRINPERLEKASELLRAVCHPLRLRIMAFIDEHEQINVNRIYNTLKLEQSITSQHLRILRLVGAAQIQRDGKYIHYSLNYDTLAGMMDAVNTYKNAAAEEGKKASQAPAENSEASQA